MKHFFLTLLLIAMVLVFGLCFLLATQSVLTGIRANALNAQTGLQSFGCSLNNLTLTCKN